MVFAEATRQGEQYRTLPEWDLSFPFSLQKFNGFESTFDLKWPQNYVLWNLYLIFDLGWPRNIFCERHLDNFFTYFWTHLKFGRKCFLYLILTQDTWNYIKKISEDYCPEKFPFLKLIRWRWTSSMKESTFFVSSIQSK